jgi:hypothetical protein
MNCFDCSTETTLMTTTETGGEPICPACAQATGTETTDLSIVSASEACDLAACVLDGMARDLDECPEGRDIEMDAASKALFALSVALHALQVNSGPISNACEFDMTERASEYLSEMGLSVLESSWADVKGTVITDKTHWPTVQTTEGPRYGRQHVADDATFSHPIGTHDEAQSAITALDADEYDKTEVETLIDLYVAGGALSDLMDIL